jgi:16S rRNA processing protein RimM
LKDSQQIAVAKIIKTQGNRGEVAADLLTDFPERFQALTGVTLEKKGDSVLSLKLDSHWFHKQRVILKFSGIDNIGSAERLIGYEVRIPSSGLMPLTSGTYYQHDLIGCVLQDSGGWVQGTVVEILGSPGNYLLRVRRDTGEFLVPFAESYFVKIDVANQVLVCDLPQGLDEL